MPLALASPRPGAPGISTAPMAPDLAGGGPPVDAGMMQPPGPLPRHAAAGGPDMAPGAAPSFFLPSIDPLTRTAPSMTPLRILYVEDNAELRETIGMLLEGEDREVTPCATAEEALALDAPRPFDIVVTDVSLPGMSGTDLCRRLLAGDPGRWIVLCSGYQFSHGLDTLGPNVRALLKPFELEDMEALMDSIRSALRGPA